MTETPRCFKPVINIIPGTLAVLPRQERCYLPKKATAHCSQGCRPTGLSGLCGVRYVGGQGNNEFRGYCPAVGQVILILADEKIMERLLRETSEKGIVELSYS